MPNVRSAAKRLEAATTLVDVALAYMQQGLDASPDGEITITKEAVESYANEPLTTRLDLAIIPGSEAIVLRRTRVNKGAPD